MHTSSKIILLVFFIALTIFSILLAIILPLFTPLLQIILLVLGLVFLILAIAMAVYIVVSRERDGVKVEETKIQITINDIKGKSARFEKIQRLTPTVKDLTEIHDRNAFIKGTVGNIELSVGEVGERTIAGKYQLIKVVFDPPLKKGKTITRKISYDITEGFTDDEVDIYIIGDYPTKTVRFIINFPDERRPKNILGFIKFKDKPREKVELGIEDGVDKIHWDIDKFSPDTQYHIEWVW